MKSPSCSSIVLDMILADMTIRLKGKCAVHSSNVMPLCNTITMLRRWPSLSGLHEANDDVLSALIHISEK